MSDRIGVMSNGRVVQVGTPTEIYETPGHLFVTTFIGESNLLEGTVQASTAKSVELALGDGTRVPAPPRAGLAAGQRVKLVIRPENVFLDGSEAGQFRLPAVVDAKIYQGALIRYRLTVAGQRLVAEVQNQVGRAQPEAGSRVTVHWYPERTEILPIE
jgi:putative spermidine/putrescine transport system ATP-binding protein